MSKPHSIVELAKEGDAIKIRAILNAPGGSMHLETAIRELAVAGHGKLLLELVANTRFYPVALKAAATVGHFTIVNNLLEALNEKSTQTYLNYVLEGASEGRHFSQVAILLWQEALNPMICLNALSSDGKLKQDDVEALLTEIQDDTLKANITSLVQNQFELESNLICR